MKVIILELITQVDINLFSYTYSILYHTASPRPFLMTMDARCDVSLARMHSTLTNKILIRIGQILEVS